MLEIERKFYVPETHYLAIIDQLRGYGFQKTTTNPQIPSIVLDTYYRHRRSKQILRRRKIDNKHELTVKTIKSKSTRQESTIVVDSRIADITDFISSLGFVYSLAINKSCFNMSRGDINAVIENVSVAGPDVGTQRNHMAVTSEMHTFLELEAVLLNDVDEVVIQKINDNLEALRKFLVAEIPLEEVDQSFYELALAGALG